MTVLVWDSLIDRIYETGLYKGVLYLSDGSAVPWNGLTSIIEQFDKEVTSVYYDGMKINDLVVHGDFKATMKAITYPDEFVELEGLGKERPGIFFGNQRSQKFGLCYRTQIGNALEGDSVGYKLHLIYNGTAIPTDKTYASVTDSPSFSEFEWEIVSIPEEILGFAPTAHVVIDSRNVDPWLLEDLEAILYGTLETDATLLSMTELVAFLRDWYRVKIIDNLDGTWTATTERDGFISVDLIERSFTLSNINATYLDADTFVISDTTDISEV